MMHQPIDGDPKSSNDPSTPLHRMATAPNIHLRDLWMSQRDDAHGCHQVSATYTFERGYRRQMTSVKFPGCFSN